MGTNVLSTPLKPGTTHAGVTVPTTLPEEVAEEIVETAKYIVTNGTMSFVDVYINGQKITVSCGSPIELPGNISSILRDAGMLSET